MREFEVERVKKKEWNLLKITVNTAHLESSHTFLLSRSNFCVIIGSYKWHLQPIPFQLQNLLRETQEMFSVCSSQVFVYILVSVNKYLLPQPFTLKFLNCVEPL